ncbi:hypothetical protein FITA111629_03130 [Filibacter tadaridae]|uniref:Uncharacterized protein n=1 Tax=Filibacter tadaridae TaxID=2483811 RepID=A0A3P5X6I4_9BACL|nr:hypothetical protein FILTAD_02471 [Filibacter tadaridae]
MKVLMVNTELPNRLHSTIGSYILDHPFHMFVHIKKNGPNDFDILYTNSLAKDYFSSETLEGQLRIVFPYRQEGSYMIQL